MPSGNFAHHLAGLEPSQPGSIVLIWRSAAVSETGLGICDALRLTLRGQLQTARTAYPAMRDCDVTRKADGRAGTPNIQHSTSNKE